VGLFTNAGLALVPAAQQLAAQVSLLVGGIVLNAVATAAYIGAGLGPGPRDGLMTGLAARGHQIRTVRTGIEVAVLAGGWLLGGQIGVGTLMFALTIGPLVHEFLPRFDRHARTARKLAPQPEGT
jgi:uncharacterized membrane protein YczE